MLLPPNIFSLWSAAAILLMCHVGSQAFAATAKFNYLLHCGGCHLPDGSGVEPEVPSLRDKLGPLTKSPEGRGYLVQVPGASQVPLTDQELRDVVNWVLVEYNASSLPEPFDPLTTDEVGKYRKQSLSDPLEYRKRFWPDESAQEMY